MTHKNDLCSEKSPRFNNELSGSEPLQLRCDYITASRCSVGVKFECLNCTAGVWIYSQTW